MWKSYVAFASKKIKSNRFSLHIAWSKIKDERELWHCKNLSFTFYSTIRHKICLTIEAQVEFRLPSMIQINRSPSKQIRRRVRMNWKANSVQHNSLLDKFCQVPKCPATCWFNNLFVGGAGLFQKCIECRTAPSVKHCFLHL